MKTLFNSDYYLANNQDIAAAGIDAYTHFVEFGALEGRNPSELFDVSYYLENNQDVAATGVNPLEHFVEFGALEGRSPSEVFDVSYYLENNQDVAATGINPLEHFMNFGLLELRSPNSEINLTELQNSNVDFANALNISDLDSAINQLEQIVGQQGQSENQPENITVPNVGSASSVVSNAINTPDPVNVAPVVAARILDGQPASIGSSFTLDVSSNFSDTDTLTYSAKVPSWLSIDANTGILSGTPTLGDKGAITIAVSVTDGSASVSQEFTIDVDSFDTRGTSGDDVITDDANAHTVHGGDGDDTIEGNNGNDVLYGGSGDDKFSDAYGEDTFYGGAGDDIIDGGRRDDDIYGGVGADTLTGGDNADKFIYLNPNESTAEEADVIMDANASSEDYIWLNGARFVETGIVTGAADAQNLGATFDGTYTIITSSNYDFTLKILGTDAVVRIGTGNLYHGLDGDENFLGEAATADTIYGGAGNDTLDGDNGNDIVYGGVGDDVITDLYGEDTLNGGEGNDTLTGGSVNDTFVFDQATSGHEDHITDFEADGDDRIALSDAVFTFATGDGAKDGVALTDGVDIFDVKSFSGGNFTESVSIVSARSFSKVSLTTKTVTDSKLATFLFDSSDGELWYDADGAAGSGTAVLIGVIDNFASYSYSASDFIGWA